MIDKSEIQSLVGRLNDLAEKRHKSNVRVLTIGEADTAAKAARALTALQARAEAAEAALVRLLPAARHYGGLTEEHAEAIRLADATIRNIRMVDAVAELETAMKALEPFANVGNGALGNVPADWKIKALDLGSHQRQVLLLAGDFHRAAAIRTPAPPDNLSARVGAGA